MECNRNNCQKKILILGTGSAQYDAIAFLKSQGHYIIGVSYKIEGKALNLVDEFEQIDIVDKEKILSLAKNKNVDLVYTIGSDLAMPTIAFVSSRLNLPSFLTEEIASLTQNKFLFRSLLYDNNICSVSFKKAIKTSELSDWDIFPAILKPVDNQGQRGVVRVADPKELNERFSRTQEYSRTKTVIIEQFIPGNEISVNGYMYNGELVYAFISDRKVIEGFSSGLVKGHDFPSSLPENLEIKARKMVREVAVCLNYLNGPIYFQMIYNSDNLYIIEGTPRFDGCHLWRLINERYNINLLEIVFNHLSGKKLFFPQVIEPTNRKDSIDFFVKEPGTIFNLDDYIDQKSNGSYFEMYYNDGEIIHPINGEMEKIGYQIKTSKL